MSPSQTASQPEPNKPPRRRAARSTPMAVEARYAHVRRRGQSAIPQPTSHDWRDWLIPAGVVGCLAWISLYHHAALAEAIGRLL
ncbi:MAG: hypothetical protein QM661_13240 [Solimonas sp.]